MTNWKLPYGRFSVDRLQIHTMANQWQGKSRHEDGPKLCLDESNYVDECDVLDVSDVMYCCTADSSQPTARVEMCKGRGKRPLFIIRYNVERLMLRRSQTSRERRMRSPPTDIPTF